MLQQPAVKQMSVAQLVVAVVAQLLQQQRQLRLLLPTALLLLFLQLRLLLLLQLLLNALLLQLLLMLPQRTKQLHWQTNDYDRNRRRPAVSVPEGKQQDGRDLSVEVT